MPMSRYLHHHTDDLDLPHPYPASKYVLSRPVLSGKTPASNPDRIEKISKLRDQELRADVSSRLDRLSRSLDTQSTEESLTKRYNRLAKTKRISLLEEEETNGQAAGETNSDNPDDDYRKVYDTWNEDRYLQVRRPRTTSGRKPYNPVLIRPHLSNDLLLEQADVDLGLEKKKTHSILDVIRDNIEADEHRESDRKELDTFAAAIAKLSLPIFHERGEHDLDFATRLERTRSEYGDLEKLVSNTFGRPIQYHLVCPPTHYPPTDYQAAGAFARTGDEEAGKEVSWSKRYPTVADQALNWAKEKLTRINNEIVRDRRLDENKPDFRIVARTKAPVDYGETDYVTRFVRPSSLDGAAHGWIISTPQQFVEEIDE